MPNMRDMVRAVGTKGSVQSTAVGIPSFSKVMPSCKLHDEQDPQSPVAVITRSHSCFSSFRISRGAGREASPLFRVATVENS